MIKLDIDPMDNKLVKRILSELGDDLKTALVDAANRAAAGVKTDAKRLIAKQYKPLKSSEIAEGITVQHASRQREEIDATAIFRGARLGLYKFAPKPSGVMGGKTEGGVSVLIGGERENFRHSFIASIRGQKNVFQRQKLGAGSKSRKLRKMTTMALPQMAADKMHDEAISEAIQEGMQERFEKRFMQQVDRLLKGFEKK